MTIKVVKTNPRRCGAVPMLKKLSETHVEKKFLVRSLLACEEEFFLEFVSRGVDQDKAYDSARRLVHYLIDEVV